MAKVLRTIALSHRIRQNVFKHSHIYVFYLENIGHFDKLSDLTITVVEFTLSVPEPTVPELVEGPK